MRRETYESFTRRLVESLERDERAVGLVALGSMAAVDYEPDEWSDHDFFVVVRVGEQASFRSDLSWLPDAERVVLSYLETEHGVKVVYDDGHLLEFAVFDAAELRLAHVNRYRVLLDRGGVALAMAEVREATVRTASQGRPDAWLVGQFLTNLLVGVGRYRRGERLSGHVFVKSYAVANLLALLARHAPSERASLADDLDPWRRFEAVHPRLGEALGEALDEEVPAAAARLLEIAARELGPVIPAAAGAAVARVLAETQSRPR